MAIDISTPYSIRLGVVGAGTMGSGIALTALLANMVVTLYDVSPEILDRARAYIQQHLARKGREISLKNLVLTEHLEDFAGAGVIIEAVPEILELKKALFTRLDGICPPPVVLATNTSSLPVTELAAAARYPARVAGMHFFNPAPVLPLVEIVQAAQSNADTIQTLVSLAELLKKTPVVTQDTPGFIVNRVARPFYGEALRLLGEGVATVAQIDLLARQGAGFRMGPFQLMDLIGIDVNFAVTQSIYTQTFGEPRYRPHPIQARMVQQKALGQKTGRGFYSYDHAEMAEAVPASRQEKHSGRAFLTPGSWSPGLADLCRQVGYTLSNNDSSLPLIALVVTGKSEGMARQIVKLDADLPPQVPIFCQCVDVTLTEVATWVENPERLVGFDGLFLGRGPVATLVASPILNPQTRQVVETFVRSLGRQVVWAADSPALILPRIVAMLVNEAAFAVSEGVADQVTIDKAMKLGANYPKGPLAWAHEMGYACVVDILDHLHNEYGEDRYRVAPLLRRWARLRQVDA